MEYKDKPRLVKERLLAEAKSLGYCFSEEVIIIDGSTGLHPILEILGPFQYLVVGYDIFIDAKEVSIFVEGRVSRAIKGFVGKTSIDSIAVGRVGFFYFTVNIGKTRFVVHKKQKAMLLKALEGVE